MFGKILIQNNSSNNAISNDNQGNTKIKLKKIIVNNKTHHIHKCLDPKLESIHNLSLDTHTHNFVGFVVDQKDNLQSQDTHTRMFVDFVVGHKSILLKDTRTHMSHHSGVDQLDNTNLDTRTHKFVGSVVDQKDILQSQDTHTRMFVDFVVGHKRHLTEGHSHSHVSSFWCCPAGQYKSGHSHSQVSGF